MEYYGTIGPACADEEVLEQMFREGMTGVRMNMSHGNLSEHGEWVEMLYRAAERAGCSMKLLIDLQGPELRIGTLPQPVELTEGSEILLGMGMISVPKIIYGYVHTGSHILLDDGKILLEVQENAGTYLNCEVKRGGVLISSKSIAVPDSGLYPPTLTQNDYQNLADASAYGVTGVMLPFVRSQEDLRTLREALCAAGAAEIEIFAKLENREGIAHLPEFLEDADCFVIARGDLGNDMPLWELPRVQKETAELLRGAGKPFMIVTQMLDSMQERSVPTRAEVCDIFNAVLDGADSIMLTGETAAGKYPVEAMRYLVRTGAEALEWKETHGVQKK